MRYTIKTTAEFRRQYKLMNKRHLDLELLDAVIEKLANGEKLATKYRDHVLSGKYKGMHECHVKPDWLLVYKIDNEVLVLTLVSTGTHADLFDL